MRLGLLRTGIAVLCAAFYAASGESVNAAEPLHARIDRLIAEKTPGYDKIAAPVSSDEEFVRRVFLDVTGMIPTANQVREFLADKSPKKRTKLIDKLLATPDYARHMQRQFDVMLMRRLPQKNVSSTEWRKFLRESFAANKPYDQLVKEILAADGTDPKNRGPASFYLDRNGSVDKLTRDIGRIFLGADLECTQCHNHPEIDDYKQKFYYGISAFLVRSYVFKDRKRKRAIFAEKGVGEVSFANVFETREVTDPKKKAKLTKTTPPRVFDLQTPKEPAFKKGQEYVKKPTKRTAGQPKFSRRKLLPQFITSPKNERFARTAANRLWAMFLGRGIVDPVDRDHGDNPPSHPELLKFLTKEFRAHKYDIKWFVRELLLSKTYQRSSRRLFSRDSQRSAPLRKASESRLNELPETAFGQAILRPMTPAQFAWSVLQATGAADIQRKSLGKKLTEAALHKRLATYETRFVALFGGQPGEPPEDFESSVDQVLFLSNDKTIVSLIKRRNGNLADRLLKLPADKSDKIAEELFLNVLSRKPTKQDVKDVTEYLKNQTGPQRTTAVQDLIWAVMTSSEFRFNH
ncbi:MAG: DUF1549 domain-containing protein [Planctomycetaceae bacterium]